MGDLPGTLTNSFLNPAPLLTLNQPPLFLPQQNEDSATYSLPALQPLAEDMPWESSESSAFPVASSGTSFLHELSSFLTCAALPLSFTQKENLGCVQNIQEKPLPATASEFPQENRPGAHTAEDTCPFHVGWKHISVGKDPSGIQGLHRSLAMDTRSVPYIQGTIASTHFATVHCLCHCDVREQSLFHRKQPGNSEFSEAWIPFLFAPKTINISGWFSPFINNKVICS